MNSGDFALFVLGWLVLLSLPILGFVLRRRQGLWAGSIGAVFAILSPGMMLDRLRLENFMAAGFFAGAFAEIAVLHPVSFWEKVEGVQGLLMGSGIVFFAALQILAMHLWGENCLILVLGSEVVLIAAYGSIRAYLTGGGGDFGFGGWEEATLSTGAILVLSFSALFIMRFVKQRGIQASYGRA